MPTPMFRDVNLAAELRTLRKGRGLQFGVPVERIGPTLRTLCDISESDSPYQTVTKVTDWLRDMITALPPDLRISAIAAFGLHDEVRLQFYQDRVEWLARRLNRDSRTVRRRIDTAIDHLAEGAGRGAIRNAGVHQFLDRTVELTFSQCGIHENDQLVWNCRILAVARDVDSSDRHYAVVTLLDQHAATIAIPTRRIQQVAPVKGPGRRRRMREHQ